MEESTLFDFSFFDEDDRFRYDHPDISKIEPLTPVRVGEQAKVQRLYWNDNRYILKRLNSQHEYRIMEQVANLGIPTPCIVDFIKLDSCCYLLLEDVGNLTLETFPYVLPSVVDTMIRLHQSFPVYRSMADAENRMEGVTDTWNERKAEIEAVSAEDWERICKRWFPNQEQHKYMQQVIEKSLNSKRGPKHYCFSHGDLHPNNIAVREDFTLAIFDFEFAGFQSIYTDLYALLDMCYPDANSCRFNFHAHHVLQQYVKRMELEWEPFYNDYLTFRLINHVREIVCCDRDLRNQIRDEQSLAAQVEWIFHQILQVQEVLA
jgi:thiamine kinase-like enzyme